MAIEVRHKDWFADKSIFEEFTNLLEQYAIANVLVDTAGRRDMIHNRLTNNEAFIRFVGANHPSDYQRLDDWIIKLKKWIDSGLQNIHFFIHQNIEKESPLLAAYFIKNLNREFGFDLQIPNHNETLNDSGQLSLL